MLKKFDLEKVFPEKTIIRTKHMNSCDWITTIVLGCHSSFIEIAQVEDYLTKVLMIGDSILCRFIKGDREYSIEALVYNIKFATRSIVLSVESIATTGNKRDFPRYDVYLSSSFSKLNTYGEIYCVTTNISHSGASITSTAVLKNSEKINFNIYFTGFHPVSTLCEVKWSSLTGRNNAYGLKIIDIHEVDYLKYSSYISKLERSEKRLKSKYFTRGAYFLPPSIT